MSAVTITTGTDTTAGESRHRAFFADLSVSEAFRVTAVDVG